MLIILGFLLYLIFGVKGEDYVEQTEEFADPKMASSVLGGILKTTIDCSTGTETKKYSVTELLQDCYNWDLIGCGSTSFCEVPESRIEFMLNKTLRDWGKSYWFEVAAGISSGKPDITINHRGCTKASRQRKPTLQPIPIMGGTLNVSLGICD